MYPPVVAITSPREMLSEDVIFSCVGSFVIDLDQTTDPSARRSLRMTPSGAAA